MLTPSCQILSSTNSLASLNFGNDKQNWRDSNETQVTRLSIPLKLCLRGRSYQVAVRPRHATAVISNPRQLQHASNNVKPLPTRHGWLVVFRVQISNFLLTFLLFFDTASCTSPFAALHVHISAVTLELPARICLNFNTGWPYLCSLDWLITRYKNPKNQFLALGRCSLPIAIAKSSLLRTRNVKRCLWEIRRVLLDVKRRPRG